MESERKSEADGMDAKNQQSHVRLIKINSFTLHPLRLSLSLSLSRLEGTRCYLSASYEKTETHPNNNPRLAALHMRMQKFGPGSAASLTFILHMAECMIAH